MRHWFSLLFKSQGRRIIIGILLTYCTAMTGLALLMLSGWFISATALTGITIAAGIAIKFDMYLPGSGIRFFALSRTVSGYIERLYNHDNVLRAIAAFRLSAFKALTALSSEQVRATRDSEWLGKLTADLDALDSLLLRYLIPPAALMLTLISLGIFLSLFWPALAFVFTLFLLLLVVVTIGLCILQTKALAASKSHMLSELRADVITHIQGALELNVSQLMTHHEQDILASLETFNGIQNRLNQTVANLQLLLDVVLGLSVMALLGALLYGVNNELISGPVAVMIVLLFAGLSELIQNQLELFSSWGHSAFAANRLLDLSSVSKQELSQSKTPTKRQKPEQYSLKANTLENIDIEIYQDPRIALSYQQALSLSFCQHDLILVTGRSGSGKSTIVSLLSKTLAINENTSQILVNRSTHLQHIASQHWYAHIGVVEQKNHMFSGSLRYNLCVGMPWQDDEDVYKVLALVELEEWARGLEYQLDTWLGETGANVSGGQARRLNIARVLLRSPSFVILDEPFNGIDATMAQRIWHNIYAFLSVRKVLLLMHECPEFVADSYISQTLSLEH